MNQYSHYFEVNKQAWNVRTGIHRDSSFYDLQGFKQGLSSLKQIELDELGSVQNKTLLHLQCHFGMDTISWSRLGAHATGIDFSGEAITLARELNEELGCNAKFICANVYDVQPQLHSVYDIVFTSYGVIGWLPDLDAWAAVISSYIKPGGTFYMVEFHPVLWMMDENLSYIKYDYFNTSVIEEEITGTYADRNAPVKLTEYGWNHPFSEIINALLTHGLRLDFLHEFPYSPFNCFNNVEQGNDGNWRVKNMGEKIPMVYSIKATKEQ